MERRDCSLPDRRDEVIGENMASPIKSLQQIIRLKFSWIICKMTLRFFLLYLYDVQNTDQSLCCGIEDAFCFLFKKKCSDMS